MRGIWQRSAIRGRGLSSVFLSAFLVIAFLVSALALPNGSVASQPPPSAVKEPIPVFAYYYIWFTEKSWDRAKTDWPVAGRYSSDDPAVMRKQIQQAKSAGIGGFMVSWKDTDALTPRLETLIGIAEEEDFKLAIIYQGLDFERDPISVDKIAADLDFFSRQYASREPFSVFAKPLVIISGTWQFTVDEIARMTTGRRDELTILASERSVEGYERLARLVDGNAYYWSSVDPAIDKGYAKKLADMSSQVHQRHGIWLAPAAPGFDARLIGGKRNVLREDGKVLRLQFAAALKSSPDLIGLISWNEFTENTHLEPSETYGDRYLRVLTDIQKTSAPVAGNLDSSEPGPDDGPIEGLPVSVPIAGGFVAAIATAFGIVAYRSYRLRPPS